MPPTLRLPILRHLDGQPRQSAFDDLAVEEPLEIRVAGRSLSVTMRTPGHDIDLAAGFLFAEGIIRSRSDLVELKTDPREPNGNRLDVTLPPHVAVDWHRLTRHVFASSSCGLCGKATLAAVQRQFPPLGEATWRMPAALLLELPARLTAAQTVFARTGGLHAAALFTPDGRLVALREDVGRHNAVDKVLGHRLLTDGLPLANHLLLVSGRASFEIVQKALAAGLPLVAAVSAPSSLAVQLANAAGQTLVGFLRPGRLNVYSHPERLT